MSSLENLSSNGIVNFDAEAYVKEGHSKYAENHENDAYLPFDKPLLATPHLYGVQPGPHLGGHPEIDAFISHKKEHPPLNWKQILIGLGAAGLATFGGIKLFSWHKAKEAAKKAKAEKLAKQSKLIKGLKTGGWIAAGVAAVYGLYKFITSRQNKKPEEHENKTKNEHHPKPVQHSKH